MPALKATFLSALALSSILGLAACKDDAERAADYIQSAQSLIQAGDLDRAKVELRNAFKYDGFNETARREMAQILLDEGDLAGAYRQYRFIAEAQPELGDVQLSLAELALQLGDAAEGRKQFDAALTLLPDDPRTRVLQTAFAYQAASDSADKAAMSAAAADANALLAELPDSMIAQRVMIDSLLQGDDPQAALPALEKALAQDPTNLQFNVIKLRLLNDAGDIAAVGAQLQEMVKLFPDNTEVSGNLIRWYMSQNDTAGAEAFLRSLAGADTGPTDGHLTIVQFLEATQGNTVARAELIRLAEANADTENDALYSALAAVIDFGQGDRDAAIATIEGLVADAAPGEQTTRIRLMLAQMLYETGNTVGARAQIEEVLTADTTNVAALKMRATWAIADDDTAAALIDLRTAIDQSPQDSDTITLMAQAYEREGNKALAGERLAQAVSVSGAAATESLRYARFLLQDGRNAAALNVLANARATNPANVDVLTLLGQQLLGQQSWVQTQRVIDDLNALGTAQATEAGRNLQTGLLVAQNRIDEGLTYLQGALGSGEADTRTVLQLVQLQLQAGNIAAARQVLNDAIAKVPEDNSLRLLDASLKAAEGDVEGSVADLRDAVTRLPQTEAPVQMLYNLLRGQNRATDATAVLDEALTRMPDSPNLNLLKAAELEAAGQIDAAIAIYDQLYTRNSSNVIVANNLASMIATYKSDTESLARAEVIARRLRDTSVPAFQDTYGWIAYRQGNAADALTYLEPAAAGLPNDPLVQFHLGMTYVALDRTDDARATLTRALDIAGDSPLPQFEEAKAALAALPPAPADTPAVGSAAPAEPTGGN